MSSSKTTKSHRSLKTQDKSVDKVAKKQQAFVLAEKEWGAAIVKEMEQLKQQMLNLREKKKNAQAKLKSVKEKRVLAAKRCAQTESNAAQNQLEKAKQAYNDSQSALETIDLEIKKQKHTLKELQGEHFRVKELGRVLKEFDKRWLKKQKEQQSKSA